jgi:peptidoglycan/LPS O-acetylase OafA/YrhL
MEAPNDMRSSNREYLASVDHLRAFAAVLIVVYHGAQLFSASLRTPASFEWLYSTNPVATLVFEGHTAVALFMVLSGFIFTVGTLGHGVVWTRFMANRLLRIYPLYLLLLVMGLAAAPAAFSLGGLLTDLLGLGNLPGALGLGPVSVMFWAIAVEMQFYLIFPLLSAVLNRFGVGQFVRLLGGVVIVRTMVWALTGAHEANAMLYYNIGGRIDQFLLGMVAAWLFAHRRGWFQGWWKTASAAALVLAALWLFNQVHAFASNSWWRLGWVDVEGGLWAVVILTYVSTQRARNGVVRALAKLGELSFSIYLLHFILIYVIIRKAWFVLVPGWSPVAEALATTVLVLVPLVLLASTMTYHGIERPFLRLRVRYLIPAGPATTRPEPAPAGVAAVPPVPGLADAVPSVVS